MRFIRNHKVWTVLISLAVGCVVIILASYPFVLRKAADLWIVSDTLDKPADAIVVLGGGIDYRPRAAADLYKQGFGKQVWITHAKPENSAPGPNAAELSRIFLIKLGVPEAAIVDVPGQASSTYEEAELVSNLIRATGGKSLIIPTDLFHTFRVKWIFTKLVGDRGIKVTVRPISSGVNSPEHWWQSASAIIYFKDEVVKYLYYRLKY